MPLPKLLALDRDGTLVRAYPEGQATRGPRVIEEIEYLPFAREAVEAAKRKGFVPVIVTNQPDIARRKVSWVGVVDVNDRIQIDLGIRHSFVCPHDTNDECACRKPQPGLLYAAAWMLGANLKGSVMVGDRHTDEKAAMAVGCWYFFVNRNDGLETLTAWLSKI